MHPRELSILDFTYDLPADRIAQQPLSTRDESKLLVFRNGSISDHHFRDLPDLLPDNALLVLNRTKVVNARIVFHRATGARIEVLCLSPANGEPVELAFDAIGQCEWHCFVGNAKRWKEGERISATIEGLTLAAERLGAERIRFSWQPTTASFAEVLDRIGHVPLPPYIDRPDSEMDKQRYNTVFAVHEGSVAAPTASLHFTEEVLHQLKSKGIRTAEVVLHVGAGTFLPVKSDLMADHTMHKEQVRIPLASLKAIRAQLGKGPIIPVGTTAVRTVESLFWHGKKLIEGSAGKEMAIGQWEPYDGPFEALPNASAALDAVIESVATSPEQRLTGSTELLIAPGYPFRFANGIVTNFHQPGSTLLLLVAAFLGKDWREVYDHALAGEYRFLSYGDSSLLLPGR